MLNYTAARIAGKYNALAVSSERQTHQPILHRRLLSLGSLFSVPAKLSTISRVRDDIIHHPTHVNYRMVDDPPDKPDMELDVVLIDLGYSPRSSMYRSVP